MILAIESEPRQAASSPRRHSLSPDSSQRLKNIHMVIAKPCGAEGSTQPVERDNKYDNLPNLKMSLMLRSFEMSMGSGSRH